MAFLVIGILVFIVGLALSRVNDRIRTFGRPAMLGGGALAVIGLLSACVVQIDAGYIGIEQLFGQVQNTVLGSGLHFINPLIDVVKQDARTQNYTMSAIHDEGAKTGDDASAFSAPTGWK